MKSTLQEYAVLLRFLFNNSQRWLSNELYGNQLIIICMVTYPLGVITGKKIGSTYKGIDHVELT